MSADGAFGIATRRFPPSFAMRSTAHAAEVFEIGLLERIGVVTSLCSPLSREQLSRDETGRTAATRRETGGLEISGTSAGLRGNFLDDSW